MSRFHLNRRTVLRGVGAGLSLPLLEIMQTSGASAALTSSAATPPVRMACLFFCEWSDHAGLEADW